MKKTKKTNLPKKIDSIEKAVENIKNPVQAEELKLWLATAKKLYHKRGEFQNAFKASELWIKADRKLYFLISPSRRRNAILAKSLNISVSRLHNLRNELKRAYDKPENEIADITKKAFNSGALLTRKWFIKGGQDSIFSRDQEWNTPAWIYERARLIMGSIDLDPATNKYAIKDGNTATKYFTKKDDGLKQDWGVKKNIFCNPPYSLPKNRSGALAFVNKLMETDYKQAIFVTIEDSGTQYGQELWAMSQAMFTPKGRIAFSGQHNNTRSSLIWGIDVDCAKFLLAFTGYGHIETYKTKADIWKEIDKRKKELKPWIEKLDSLPEP